MHHTHKNILIDCFFFILRYEFSTTNDDFISFNECRCCSYVPGFLLLSMKKKNSKAKQKKNQRIAFIIMDRNEKKEYSFRFFFEWSKKKRFEWHMCIWNRKKREIYKHNTESLTVIRLLASTSIIRRSKSWHSGGTKCGIWNVPRLTFSNSCRRLSSSNGKAPYLFFIFFLTEDIFNSIQTMMLMMMMMKSSEKKAKNKNGQN